MSPTKLWRTHAFAVLTASMFAFDGDALAAISWTYPLVHIDATINNASTPTADSLIADSGTRRARQGFYVVGFTDMSAKGRGRFYLVTHPNNTDAVFLVQTKDNKQISFPISELFYDQSGEIKPSVDEEVIEFLFKDFFARLFKSLGGKSKVEKIFNQTYMPTKLFYTSEYELKLIQKYAFPVKNFCVVGENRTPEIKCKRIEKTPN
jgi:hypothetical protein